MSSTLLSIRTDEQTKKQIADFAASVGLTTSAFATAVLTQAVRDRQIVLKPALEPTPHLEEIMRRARADREAGRNYTTVKTEAELDDFFDKL